MKIIVTHSSPDMDAGTSIWLIKKFLPGWEDATVQFVPAGERLRGMNQESRIKNQEKANEKNHDSLFIIHNSPIEHIGKDEVIHVDTGLGPLDHHQTKSDLVSAASLTWDYVKVQSSELKVQSSDRMKTRVEAIDRIVRVVVDIDHFKEVFWGNPSADYHEFSLVNLLEGLKFVKPNDDQYCVDFILNCLNIILHEFENRIWAERELKENSIKFTTRFGRGIGFETINDTVIKLSQKLGYVIVIRKDPRKGYVRVKARPSQIKNEKLKIKNDNIDLTLAYEKLKKMDPTATWFLHVSRKMLLNGSPKNPKMRPTRLSLSDIIGVLKTI